jgi:pimeloyl-ACP methyl ester carboxylesterase
VSRSTTLPTSFGDGELPELGPAALPREPWNARLFTGFGSALDATVLRAMQFVVERALIPDPQDVDALRRSAGLMLGTEIQTDPGRFFGFLEQPPQPPRMWTGRRRRLEGGVALDCRIESDYLPYGADVAGADGTPIHVEHWRHDRGRPRGTVVALHGFTMGRPRLDAIVLLANHWYRRGLDVALLTLPYHGARTPADSRFSGEHFAVPDVGRLGEAVREAIYEVRRVTHWLREESGAPVGVLGLSLGGYLAALAAGLCDDLDFVVPIVPPVSMGDLAWRFYTRTRHHREGGEAALSRDELRRSFRVHSPLAHPLRIPRERVLIVAGRGDRIVPPEHPAALHRHWGEPAIHWFSGSHLAPFGRGRVARRILAHLESIGIL